MGTKQLFQHILERFLLDEEFLPGPKTQEKHFKQCQRLDHKDCGWPAVLTIPAGSLQACCDASRTAASQGLISRLAEKEIRLKVDHRYGFLGGIRGLAEEEISDGKKELARLLWLDNKERIFRYFRDMYFKNLKPRSEVTTEAVLCMFLEYYINHHLDHADHDPGDDYVLIDRDKAASALDAPPLAKILKAKTTRIPLPDSRPKTRSGSGKYIESAGRPLALSSIDLKPYCYMAAAERWKDSPFDLYGFKQLAPENQFLETSLKGFEDSLEHYLRTGIFPELHGSGPGYKDPESVYDHMVDDLEKLTAGYLAIKIYPGDLPSGRAVLYRQLTQLHVRLGDLADHYLPSLRDFFKKDDLVRCIELKHLDQANDDLEFYPVADLPTLLASLD